MNIILDTNVVISDCGYFFNSRDFGILIEYLDQTASKLLLPQIIIDELISCYEDELEKANCLIDKATKLLNPLKHDLKTSFKNKENLNSYKSFIFKDFLNRYYVQVVPYKNDYLPEVMRRSINRLSPCTSKGEETRDTLLWLHVLELAINKVDSCIFITNDGGSFVDKQTGKLYQALLIELEEKKIVINFHRNLNEFIKNEPSLFKDVDKTWVKARLTDKELINFITEKLLPDYENKIVDWYEKYMDYDFHYEDLTLEYIDGFTGEGSIELLDCSLFKLKSGEIQLRSTYELYLETEATIKGHEPFNRDDTYTTHKTFELPLKIVVSSLVKKDKLSEHEIEKWELPEVISSGKSENGGYIISKRLYWSGAKQEKTLVTAKAYM